MQSLVGAFLTSYKLYEEMVSLNENFSEYSKRTGIPITIDRNGQIVSITTLKKKNVLELENPADKPAEILTKSPQKSVYRNDDDDQYEESSYNPYNKKHEESEAIVPIDMGILRTANQCYLQQKSRVLTRFRYIVFLHCINDIPVRQLKTHPSETFWIEIEVLDQVLRYKVEPQFLQMQKDEEDQSQDENIKDGLCRIDMNRLSVKYFFSNGRDSLRDFIQEAKVEIVESDHRSETHLWTQLQRELPDRTSRLHK